MGPGAVGARKAVGRRQSPDRVHLEHRPDVRGPAPIRRAVEAPVAGLDQASRRRAVAAGKAVERRQCSLSRDENQCYWSLLEGSVTWDG